MMTSKHWFPVVALLAGSALSPSAQAQLAGSGSLVEKLLNPSTSATCLISGHRAFSPPGISLVPSRGTFYADQETKLTCVGQIDGKRLAGPAHLELTGTYGEPSPTTPQGDTCLFGSMIGNVVTQVETVDGGTIELSGQIRFTRVGLELTAEGPLGPPAVTTHVLIVAVPDVGQTCATVPVTGVSIAGIVRIYGK